MTDPTRHPFDRRFWKRFASQIWEKKHLVLKNIDSPLREMTPEQIFTLLVSFADDCRKRRNPEGFKFYVDGQKLYDDEVLQNLPRKMDKTLLGYHKRMNSQYSDYCLVCDELLQVQNDKQVLLADFTAELYRHVGFPNRFSELGLYLGNYRKTPFGVHVDGCGVFSFPIIGQKKFRLWSDDFVRKNPDLIEAHTYTRFKKNSRLLTAEPGDMVYWPSSDWHIAESDGAFSATWSLGVWVDRPHRDDISENLMTLLNEKLGARAQYKMVPFQQLHQKNGQVKELPEIFRDSISELLRLSENEIKNHFLKAWMNHISKQGFKVIPKERVKIKMTDRLRLRQIRSPILWLQSERDGKTLYSSGGVLVEHQNSKNLLKLVKALNSGQSCQIQQFLNGTSRAQDLKCLQILSDAGAF